MGVLTPLAQATAFVKLLVSDAHAVGGRWSFFFPYKLCEKNPRDECLTGDGYICHKQDGGRGNKRALCFSPQASKQGCYFYFWIKKDQPHSKAFSNAVFLQINRSHLMRSPSRCKWVELELKSFLNIKLHNN